MLSARTFPRTMLSTLRGHVVTEMMVEVTTDVDLHLSLCADRARRVASCVPRRDAVRSLCLLRDAKMYRHHRRAERDGHVVRTRVSS